jgi:hypothetical protein
MSWEINGSDSFGNEIEIQLPAKMARGESLALIASVDAYWCQSGLYVLEAHNRSLSAEKRDQAAKINVTAHAATICVHAEISALDDGQLNEFRTPLLPRQALSRVSSDADILGRALHRIHCTSRC